MNKPNQPNTPVAAANDDKNKTDGTLNAAAVTPAPADARPEVPQVSPKEAVKGPFTQIPPKAASDHPLSAVKADVPPAAMSQQQSASAAEKPAP